jgi:DNA-binding transcriptional MerR regulator
MGKEKESGKLYAISEVSEIAGVKAHLLRQWEANFPQLRPRRLPSGKRAYTDHDIKIVRRIKTMLQHDGMTSKGARVKLAQELREVSTPKDLHEMLDLADRIADEARAIIHLFDEEEEEYGEEE